MELHLSRREHDRLMDLNPALLREAFATCARDWSLAGVTFKNPRDDLANAIRSTLA